VRWLAQGSVTECRTPLIAAALPRLWSADDVEIAIQNALTTESFRTLRHFAGAPTEYTEPPELKKTAKSTAGRN